MTTLNQKLQNRDALVGVIGLGYVGLPLAVAFGEAGFSVLGFEVDSSKVDALLDGTSYIPDIDASRIADLLEAKRLDATTDFSRLSDCDAISVCVPTLCGRLGILT